MLFLLNFGPKLVYEPGLKLSVQRGAPITSRGLITHTNANNAPPNKSNQNLKK